MSTLESCGFGRVWFRQAKALEVMNSNLTDHVTLIKSFQLTYEELAVHTCSFALINERKLQWA